MGVELQPTVEAFTEAVAKETENKTPYKVVGTPQADSVLSGKITTDTKRVIIEDEYALAAALATVVRRLGAEPVVAASGQGGLDKVQRQAGYDALAQQGFRRLDFISHGPIWSREWSTAIFYRPDNCVGL